MKPSGAWGVFRYIWACLIFMSRTLFTLIFREILQPVHLTGNMRRPRRRWPEIRQVCAVCCKPISPISTVAHAYAKKVGLDIDWTDPFATISKLAWLTQTPKEFDFESSHWPTQFHYTGPFHDGFGRVESNFPWDRLTGEPLIYASMGTLQNGLESVSPPSRRQSDATGDTACALHRSRPRSRKDKLVASQLYCRKNAPQVELLKRSAPMYHTTPV